MDQADYKARCERLERFAETVVREIEEIAPKTAGTGLDVCFDLLRLSSEGRSLLGLPAPSDPISA